jgi:hypothetical protein
MRVVHGETQSAYTTYAGIGLHAIQSSSGFRRDGSYHYGNHYFGVYEEIDVRFEGTLARVARRDSLFAAGAQLDAPRVARLRVLLAGAHARGARIVVFLPPLAPPVRRAMQEHLDLVRLIDGVRHEAARIVADLGPRAEFHEFGTGDDPCEYVDGIHAGDVVFQRFLLDVTEHSPRSTLAALVDAPSVRRAVGMFAGHAVSSLDPARYRARERDFLRLGCAKS